MKMYNTTVRSTSFALCLLVNYFVWAGMRHDVVESRSVNNLYRRQPKISPRRGETSIIDKIYHLDADSLIFNERMPNYGFETPNVLLQKRQFTFNSTAILYNVTVSNVTIYLSCQIPIPSQNNIANRDKLCSLVLSSLSRAAERLQRAVLIINPIKIETKFLSYCYATSTYLTESDKSQGLKCSWDGSLGNAAPSAWVSLNSSQASFDGYAFDDVCYFFKNIIVSLNLLN
jgi:hypothetical protein